MKEIENKGLDVISILNILKEFWAIARYRAPPQHVLEKSQ
jgi:hypothetical protein